MNRVFLSLLFWGVTEYLSATTYVVDNLADPDDGLAYTAADGTNTLRKCIRLANANGVSPDIINFSVSGTINPGTNLPALTGGGITIDGSTAPGGYVANSNLTGALNGTLKVSISFATIALRLSSDNNIIKGLNFRVLDPAGVMIDITAGADNNQILGCYLGTSLAGTASDAGNATYGVLITNAANNKIGDGTAAGRNLISGLPGTRGIYITGASSTGNTIKGNIIGLNKTGVATLASNAQYPVWVTGSAEGNTIGGTAAGEGNVISGNATFGGIYLASTGVAGNSVLGNIIGPQANGISFVTGSSQSSGIYISDSPNNSIGGSAAGARNIISGNASAGITIAGAASTGNLVKGNYIGLDQNGTTFIASSAQDYGVYVTSTSGGSNTIGGTGAGEENVISGNILYGIYLNSTAAAGNTVLGNIIGPQVDGTSNVTSNAQTHGVYISSSPNNTIGGGAAGAKNIISANLSYGVFITGASSTGNSVKGNYLGLDITGATFITGSSQAYGLSIETSAASNIIGGTGAEEGNVISGNTSGGAAVTSSAVAGNTFLGNIIGPLANGTGYVTSSNQVSGLFISGSRNNIIGGSAGGASNIISANTTYGIQITGAGSTGNSVKGNYIGTDITGTAFIAGSNQDRGVYLTTSAASNTIGGTVAGEGNLISGNSSEGINTNSAATAGNTVLGNIIGPQADGITNITSNAQTSGIYITGSPNNTIGGSIAGARNIISANLSDGVNINGAGSTGNVVKGNYIGLDITGTTFITGSDQDHGVNLLTSAASNTIGGTGADEGNVISGNITRGIFIQSGAVGGNTVLGNIVGPQADGAANVTSNSQDYGIQISSSPNNIIGGSAAGAKNIISANILTGIHLVNAGSTGNSVKGNYIGLDINGTTFIAGSSQSYGVYITISAASNTIGGTGADEGNVISGNITYGVYTTSAGAAGNSVLGNTIGPQADGTNNVTANSQNIGVSMSGSPNNTIGGNTAGARNIISANLDNGVAITGASATGNSVKGNYIGLDINGTNFIASTSQDYGVYINTSAASNTIGGSGANEGNVISGNVNYGVYSTSAGAAGNSVLGNIIGPQANGTTNVGSNDQNYGVYLSSSMNNTIGGNTVGARNIISGNLDNGIIINGASSTGNSVKGNYIGLDINGTSLIAGATQDYGVYMSASAASNTIGGTGADEGNVISGNTYGMYIISAATAGNTVTGNIIGPQANGTSNVASNAQNYGVYITGSPNNAIGGSAAGAKNIISANLISGVYISGAASTGNLVKGNYIGPGSALANIASSNQDYGVTIISSAANNRIGGTAAGEGNTIAFNTAGGIYVFNVASTGNLISRNSIYTNTGKQINLNYGANQGNIGKSAPSITIATTATVVGTGAGAGGIVEVFKNTGGLSNDATNYVGFATADGSGNWSLNVGGLVAAGDYVLANATDGSNNTSEFSSPIFPLPVEWLSFNATAENNSVVKCEWATASEMNNDYFSIERSLSPFGGGAGGGNWEQIGTVKGAGNSSTTLHYEFVDTELPLPTTAAATFFYRLRQVDYNGQYAYSAIRQVDISAPGIFSVYPTLSSGDFSLSFNKQKDKEVLFVIRNIVGQEFYSKEFIIDNDLFIESVNLSGKLAPGIYLVIASSDDRVFGKRIVIK